MIIDKFPAIKYIFNTIKGDMIISTKISCYGLTDPRLHPLEFALANQYIIFEFIGIHVETYRWD